MENHSFDSPKDSDNQGHDSCISEIRLPKPEENHEAEGQECVAEDDRRTFKADTISSALDDDEECDEDRFGFDGNIVDQNEHDYYSEAEQSETDLEGEQEVLSEVDNMVAKKLSFAGQDPVDYDQ